MTSSTRCDQISPLSVWPEQLHCREQSCGKRVFFRELGLLFGSPSSGTLITPHRYSVIPNRGNKYRAQGPGIREKRLTMQESTSILPPWPLFPRMTGKRACAHDLLTTLPKSQRNPRHLRSTCSNSFVSRIPHQSANKRKPFCGTGKLGMWGCFKEVEQGQTLLRCRRARISFPTGRRTHHESVEVVKGVREEA